HAKKFLKTVKPSTRVPALKDSNQDGAAVDGTNAQIKTFMIDYLHLEGYGKLMQAITGSSSFSDWSSGLQRIVSPGTGRNMWVCHDCFRGMQTGHRTVYQERRAGWPRRLDCLHGPFWHEERGSSKLQMIKKQRRMKSDLLCLSPAEIDHLDCKATA
ncbi:hypothetical protein BGZ90_000909, partial [Linnemannia elongata]